MQLHTEYSTRLLQADEECFSSVSCFDSEEPFLFPAALVFPGIYVKLVVLLW